MSLFLRVYVICITGMDTLYICVCVWVQTTNAHTRIYSTDTESECARISSHISQARTRVRRRENPSRQSGRLAHTHTRHTQPDQQEHITSRHTTHTHTQHYTLL